MAVLSTLNPAATLGTTPDECGTVPSLLLDLSLALLPRRVALARGLFRLLGPGTIEKVASRWDALSGLLDRLETLRTDADVPLSDEDLLRTSRDAVRAMGELEDALFGLVNARVKSSLRCKGAVA